VSAKRPKLQWSTVEEMYRVSTLCPACDGVVRDPETGEDRPTCKTCHGVGRVAKPVKP